MANYAQSNDLTIKEIRAKLLRLSTLLDDMSPIMREIGAILERDVNEAFQNEWNPSNHHKWVDLDNKTIQQRQRKNKWPGKKLQVTGELISTLSSDYGRKFARVGVNKDYATTMQFGRKDKNIPARPFLPFDGLHPDTVEDIMAVINSEMTNAID